MGASRSFRRATTKTCKLVTAWGLGLQGFRVFGFGVLGFRGTQRLSRLYARKSNSKQKRNENDSRFYMSERNQHCLFKSCICFSGIFLIQRVLGSLGPSRKTLSAAGERIELGTCSKCASAKHYTRVLHVPGAFFCAIKECWNVAEPPLCDLSPAASRYCKT